MQANGWDLRPSTEGQVDMMYQIGDEHWLKSFCNREQNVTEWSKPLLVPVVGDARNLDPRRKFCEARKPSAYKGDPLAVNKVPFMSSTEALTDVPSGPMSMFQLVSMVPVIGLC